MSRRDGPLQRSAGRRAGIAALLAGLLLYAPVAHGAPALCALGQLPEPTRTILVDDLKLLIGWAFDAAVQDDPPAVGAVIDRHSGYPGIGSPVAATPMGRLAGRYRVLRPPFDEGRGYYGLLLGALDREDRIVALLLVNRLFRLPVAHRDPLGLLTDLTTNGAMMTGLDVPALAGARRAAIRAHVLAGRIGVPLVIAGQSQAGAMAHLQVALLQSHRPDGGPAAFVTFNAAHALAWVRRLGLAPGDVEGLNISKDRDPGFGPHAPLASRIGLQLYVHADGSAGPTPEGSLTTALLHPAEHTLERFLEVPLAQPVARMLAHDPAGCR